MNKKLITLGLFLSTFLMARSSVDRQLDNCSGDLTCVAKVLAELIEINGSNSGGNNNSNEIVEFYSDDGRCEFDNLLKRVNFGISSDGCARAAQTVTKRVWGIKMNGVCSDISDTDFLNACNKYASVDKSRTAKKQ